MIAIKVRLTGNELLIRQRDRMQKNLINKIPKAAGILSKKTSAGWLLDKSLIITNASNIQWNDVY